MTDFIHEHPKDGQPAAPQPAVPGAEPAMDERTGQKRVYGYIFILFVVAFSLLLWAFLMNQRSTDEVLSELRGNAGALQSTLDRNVELENEVEALEQKNAQLDARVQELERGKAELEQSEQALREETENADKLCAFYAAVAELEYACARKDYDRCRELIENGLLNDYAEGRFAAGEGEAEQPFTAARFEEICRTVGFELPVENETVSRETKGE